MAKTISGQIPARGSFLSLERTLDRTIAFLVNSNPTPEVRALLIEARRLRSVVANWRSIPPPADVHEEMLDRVMALSTAAGAPHKVEEDWEDRTLLEREPEIPSLMRNELEAQFDDPEKTEGFAVAFDRSKYNLDSDEPPSSDASMVVWSPTKSNEVVAPPPPSLGFSREEEPAARRKLMRNKTLPLGTPITASHDGDFARSSLSPPNAAPLTPVPLAPIRDAEILPAEHTPAQLERRTADGRIEVRHPDGRVEVRHPDRRVEIRYNDGRQETRYADGRTECRYADGRTETRYADGAIEMRFNDGRMETRYYDGRVETRFADGRVELRHSDGRIETRFSDAVDRPVGRAGPPATKIEVRPIKLPEKLPPHVVLLGDPYSERADAFRALRRKLAATGNPRTIAMMSPKPSEGKSTAALNLALALRETARGRVLLVEANMRAPILAKLLQFEPPECFVDQMVAHRDDPFGPWTAAEQGGTLHIIAVSPNSQRPPLLDPVAFNTAMERLKLAGYEYIVLDTPPVLGSVDANLIADNSDGVIMTSWSLKTTKTALRKAVKQLSPAPVLGVVVIEG